MYIHILGMALEQKVENPMPDKVNFGDCSCFNLRRAARRVTQIYDHALAPSALKATQFALLAVLDRSEAGEGIAMTRLAEKLGTDRTTLTRNLRVVERDGLAAITTGEDTRSRLVVLTEAGRTALKRAAPLWARAQAEMKRHIGNDQKAFLELTRRLAAI
ncbi:MAG: MarR family winged helix-turn-helix transcriptional regulator [Methyloligellaceae bacterium]